MLTGRSKRACLCREVPTDHEAHGQTQRWLQNSKSFGGTFARRPKQHTRSTIEATLKPFARAKDDLDANYSSCALRSHTFTRGARRERTVVLVNPADHAQHVKERAVHENVTQGVMDSPHQRPMRSQKTQYTLQSDGRTDDPGDKKDKRADPQRVKRATTEGKCGPTAGEKNSANCRST